MTSEMKLTKMELKLEILLNQLELSAVRGASKIISLPLLHIGIMELTILEEMVMITISVSGCQISHRSVKYTSGLRDSLLQICQLYLTNPSDSQKTTRMAEEVITQALRTGSE